MSDRYNIIIETEQIIKRVESLAKQINSDYAGKTLDLVCLVNSAQFFTTDLVKYLTVPTRLHYLGFTSYQQGNETGEVRYEEEYGIGRVITPTNSTPEHHYVKNEEFSGIVCEHSEYFWRTNDRGKKKQITFFAA